MISVQPPLKGATLDLLQDINSLLDKATKIQQVNIDKLYSVIMTEFKQYLAGLIPLDPSAFTLSNLAIGLKIKQ
jgi:hypothetical protein